MGRFGFAAAQLGGLGGGGGGRPPQFDESRMGGSETFERPAGIPKLIVPPHFAIPLPLDLRCILEVNLRATQAEPDYSSGSWVLTIDHEAFYTDAGIDPSTPRVAIAPLRTVVTIGTGGGTQQFEVDTKNQSFQLPAANIKVNVGWDASIPDNNFPNNPGSIHWQLPDRIVVRAQVQRGVSSGRATRSLWLPIHDSSGIVRQIIPGNVPNFARCVRLWGLRENLNVSPATVTQFFGGPPPDVGFLDFNTEDGLLSINTIRYYGQRLLDPAGVPVPALAQTWALSRVGTPSVLGPLEFDVVL